MWNDRVIGEKDILAIEVKDIDMLHAPTANFVWHVGGVAIPKVFSNHYINSVARFFEGLSGLACGGILPSDKEQERISEQLGYWYYATNEFIDGLNVWIKTQGPDGKLTIAKESVGFKVSAIIPCVVFQTVAAELSTLARDAVEEGIRRRA